MGLPKALANQSSAFKRPEQPTPATVSARTNHTLNVLIENGTAKGYVDGVLCDMYKMADYQPGFVGVAALPAVVQGKSFFDNFAIYRWP